MTALSERPVRIKVFKNGDRTSTKSVVLNKRYFRTFDGLLEDCTRKLKLTTPARDICTPTGGTRVHNFEAFQQDGNYVVLSTGPFKKLEYADFKQEPQFQTAAVSSSPIKPAEITPVAHSRIQTSAKYKKIRNEITRIFVYANGNALGPAMTLTLTERELKNWDVVLAKITDKVNLTSGAVRKLYDIEGQMITDPGQIEKNQYYVAVGAENKLKRLNYGSERPLFNSPRQRRDFKPNDPFAPPKRRRTRRIGDSATTDSSPTTSTAPSNKTSHTRYSQQSKVSNNSRTKEEDSVFHARPIKYKRSSEKSRKRADYDKDDGGVFKAKQKDSDHEDAAEVEETRDTKVDLPVDQMEAQEVEEEEIVEKPKAKETLHKKPIKAKAPRAYARLAASPDPPRTPPSRQPTPHEPTPPPREPTPRELTPHELTPREHEPTPEPREPTPPPREPTPPQAASKPTSQQSSRQLKIQSRHSEKPQSRQSEKPQSRQSEKPQLRESEKPQSRQSEKPQLRESEKPQSRQSEKPQSKQSKRSAKADTPPPEEENNVEEVQENKDEGSQDDEAQKRDDAAIKIQAGYRGYRVRKDFKNNKNKLDDKNNDDDIEDKDDDEAAKPMDDEKDEYEATNHSEDIKDKEANHEEDNKERNTPEPANGNEYEKDEHDKDRKDSDKDDDDRAHDNRD